MSIRVEIIYVSFEHRSRENTRRSSKKEKTLIRMFWSCKRLSISISFRSTRASITRNLINKRLTDIFADQLLCLFWPLESTLRKFFHGYILTFYT